MGWRQWLVTPTTMSFPRLWTRCARMLLPAVFRLPDEGTARDNREAASSQHLPWGALSRGRSRWLPPSAPTTAVPPGCRRRFLTTGITRAGPPPATATTSALPVAARPHARPATRACRSMKAECQSTYVAMHPSRIRHRRCLNQAGIYTAPSAAKRSRASTTAPATRPDRAQARRPPGRSVGDGWPRCA
jgi:hypothetical protein